MDLVDQHTSQIGTAASCKAFGVSRATVYRRRKARELTRLPVRRPSPPRALSQVEKQETLDILHSERFVDKAPAQVWATLLDENKYICSTRTMYRILAENDEVRERRNQLRHPEYTKPELLATCPNEVWSWDITDPNRPPDPSNMKLFMFLSSSSPTT